MAPVRDVFKELRGLRAFRVYRVSRPAGCLGFLGWCGFPVGGGYGIQGGAASVWDVLWAFGARGIFRWAREVGEVR